MVIINKDLVAYCPKCGKRTFYLAHYDGDCWWMAEYECESCGFSVSANEDRMNEAFTEVKGE